MKPLDFLAEVLPSPASGLYCVAELSSNRKEHVFVQNLEEIKPVVKRWLQSGRDIYFALATFDPKVQSLTRGRRSAENAVAIKSIFIDMDGYESKKAAALALQSFLEKTGLDEFSRPYIVSSGGGLHCYWPLEEAVDIVTWRPIAENFKRLCKQEGLAIDQTVTADAARVLRIPGTFNNKKKYGEPRPVKVLVEGDGAIDLRRFGATVRGLLSDAYAPASNSFLPTSVDIKGTRPTKATTKRSAMAEALMNNAKTRFETIWIRSEQGVGCGQLQFYRDNATQDGMEPLWRGLLSWTKVCEDGQTYSEKLTDLHPYTRERMESKLAEIKGPYPCVKMDSENPGVCPKCPHWGRITNALALGREIKTDNKLKTFEVPIQAHEDDAPPEDVKYLEDAYTSEEDEADIEQNTRLQTMERALPPRGYDYGEHGGVYVKVKEKDATGVEVSFQLQVLPHDLFVVDLLRMDEREHYAHLMAIKQIGAADGPKTTQYTPIVIPSKAVVSREELLKSLASYNIYSSSGLYTDPHLHNYVRAAIQEAAMLKKAIEVPSQFGWQKNGSFVYNHRVFTPDGDEVAIPMPGLENLNRITNSKGTLEGWRKPWEMLRNKKLYDILTMCVDSFGSTLMHFSDYEGFVWHVGSSESGTGKSLALSLKAGVWGHPVYYRTGKSTSPVAMQQRAGLLNSLPLLIDEITSKARNDFEWAPAFIFDISEGQGKERMESGANKERINNSTWKLTCSMTSNTHMTDILTGGRKHSSSGELMRMLEWTLTEELQFNHEEREILKELRRNYGVAGEAWVRWSVKNQPTIRTVRAKVHEQLRKEMEFTDEERYWHVGCTSTVTAAVLLGPKYSDILQVPVSEIVATLKRRVDVARAAYRRSSKSAEDVLNAYTREFYGKFVIIRRDEAGNLLAELGKDSTGKTSTKHTVMGRIEHGTRSPQYVEYFIEEQLLKQHCASMSYGYSDFKRQIAAMRTEGYAVNFGVKKDLLARTDGPSLRVNVMHLSIPKDKLDQDADQISLGKN